MVVRKLLSLVVGCTLLVPLGAGGSTAGASIAGDTAEDADPIPASLTALDELVSAANCAPRDAADGDIANGFDLPYVFCDDGVPPSGGGSLGIPVPAKYAADASGNDHKALPAPASEEELAEADARYDLQPESGNQVALDVDITLPASQGAVKQLGVELPTIKRPRGGFPVIVTMHGCCGGSKTSWQAATIDAAREQWHHSNAWWASQGYVVVNFTARGFRNSNDQGSTGTTQLNSRSYEINDYQYLVGLLADLDVQRRAEGEKPIFKINPRKIGVVGGSYGGGFSWLALTDPTWKSPSSGVPVRLAAAAPKYGWTDLLESLVPSGHYRDTSAEAPTKTEVAPSTLANAPSRHPFGVEKLSIVAGLYGTGNNVSGNHTTFPQYLHDAYVRLQQGEPYDGDETLENLAESFLSDRSAYFQSRFWSRVKKGLEVPVFSVGTWTDPLFPTMEHLRFYNKVRSLNPDYPIVSYYGDYQHFVANKAKEWGDLCGDDHHVCTIDDFRDEGGALSLRSAATRVRKGINTRINEFFDRYLMGEGKTPRATVSATTTICAANATEVLKADEPGVEYRASTWRKLAPKSEVITWETGGMIASAATDGHALDSDPVFRDRQANKCFTTTQTQPGPGVLHLESDPLGAETTLLGLPVLKLDYDTTSAEYWVSARVMDLAPSGSLTLVSRGICKANPGAAPEVSCEDFAMSGNAWIFGEGHRIVLEVSQSDTPFLRRTNTPTTMTVNGAELRLPVAAVNARRDFRD